MSENLKAIQTLDERKDFIVCKNKNNDRKIKCDKNSVEGAVSQRACVYCGARVVLNPITDAIHIVHGPIGCASYTWDIRGSLSSGKDYYRSSFSTDLQEHDIIFGGEKKLSAAIDEIVEKYPSEVIFVYSTCVVGVIGDDLAAVCKDAAKKHNTQVIPIQSTGFAGNKSSGYRAACDALLTLMESNTCEKKENGINILGEFNLAGEIWILKNYLKQIGIDIVSKITGDSTCAEIKNAPNALFNIVQCAGSMMYLAKEMEEKYSIPFLKVSFFGIEDTVNSLNKIAFFSQDKEIMAKAKEFTEIQSAEANLKVEKYRKKLAGKRAAIYVGGGFKAISLIKQFNDLGIKTVMVGTQTGKEDDYEMLKSMTEEGTVIIDDANPAELEKLIKSLKADILVGGVKERPLAYKLGVAFCDHNHERKIPLCGFEGAVNFAREIDSSINSPVWKHIREKL